MKLALRKPMTLDEFLAWEERQELRYEFDGFQPVATTGGSYAHDTIIVNLARELGSRLRGKPCQPHGSKLKVRTHTTVRYPDAHVSCGSYRLDSKLARDPVVIFEVLSPSTERTDLVAKNEEYEALPSVRRYVILRQDRIGGLVFERVGADWIGHLLRPGAVLHMPEIGIELPLADLYERIVFPAPGEASTPDAAPPVPDNDGEPA